MIAPKNQRSRCGTTIATRPVVPRARREASGEATNESCSATARTRPRRRSDTRRASRSALDAVANPTPARRATSSSVTFDEATMATLVLLEALPPVLPLLLDNSSPSREDSLEALPNSAAARSCDGASGGSSHANTAARWSRSDRGGGIDRRHVQPGRRSGRPGGPRRRRRHGNGLHLGPPARSRSKRCRPQ